LNQTRVITMLAGGGRDRRGRLSAQTKLGLGLVTGNAIKALPPSSSESGRNTLIALPAVSVPLTGLLLRSLPTLLQAPAAATRRQQTLRVAVSNACT